MKENHETIWEGHHQAWRDPASVVSLHTYFQPLEKERLAYRTYGHFWETLHKLRRTLIIGREYEHFVVALNASSEKPKISYFPLPHPSGIAYDIAKKVLYVASTRNPNSVFTFAPVSSYLDREDLSGSTEKTTLLYPISNTFFPGSTYFHDLAIIEGDLYANAVAHNSVVKLDLSGHFQYAWWPKSLEKNKKPIADQNYIQLNSIAAGSDLAHSVFSASSDAIGKLRPGHINYPVDKRGVLFSGLTREPIVRGLTRPHSARQWRGRIYVDNSGYGEVGLADGEKFLPITKINGWTRGLSICNDIAFFGTSRVIPKFHKYAPGLDPQKSKCGIHALDLKTGKIVGGIWWENGNQIFAIEAIPDTIAVGFPFTLGADDKEVMRKFYSFQYL